MVFMPSSNQLFPSLLSASNICSELQNCLVTIYSYLNELYQPDEEPYQGMLQAMCTVSVLTGPSPVSMPQPQRGYEGSSILFYPHLLYSKGFADGHFFVFLVKKEVAVVEINLMYIFSEMSDIFLIIVSNGNRVNFNVCS